MEADLPAATYLLDMQILVTVMVAGGWWALYRPLLAQTHYRWWAWGWTAFLLFLVGARISVALPPTNTLAGLLQAPAGLVQVACFVLGAEALRRGEEVSRRWRRTWLALAAALGLCVGLLQLPVESDRASLTLGTLARSPALGLALLYCGWQFLQRQGGRRSVATWITAAGFLLYGLDQMVYTVGGVSEAVALLTGAQLPGFGVELILSDVFFLADMAWEASIGVGAILLLVDEKDRLFRASRRDQRRFRALFENSADGILVTDPEGRIQAVNPAAGGMLDAGDDELRGQSLQDLFVGSEAELPPDLRELEERGGLTLEATCRTLSGDEFPVELTLSAYELEDRVYIQILMRDISTRKALMEELMHRATHHPLTDLPNRDYLHEQLDRLLAMKRRDQARPAVLFLDLDQFKSVNDTYGHNVGDDLLIAVADRLRDTVRETELVGHMGGDEFVVLVPWCRSDEVLHRIGHRVARALSETYDAGGHQVEITVSIGGAAAGPEETADELIQRADRAMYRAKERPEAEATGVFVTPET